MRRIAITITVLLLSCATARAAEPALETDDQKTLYAIGLALGRSLDRFKLTPEELVFVQSGIADVVLDREKKVDQAAYNSKIQALQQTRTAALAADEKKAGATYLAKAAAESGAKKTDSGIVYSVITPGKGEVPKAGDQVKVHYTGKLIDGTVFDSSVQRGTPATFPLTGVIKCWTEGLQLMKVGEKATLVCPSDIAYGDQGRPPMIKPGATLVFEVELIEIVKPAAATTPPAATPPPAAK
jgi:FKBP-type peptidyl-prolyl cis-trans isomerase FkpA/FKBP-type peptidyl-prolyl cis-trans isomerase FklB